MYKTWCFLLLVFLTGVAVAMLLAVPDSDVMENGGGLQDLLVLNGKLLLFSKPILAIFSSDEAALFEAKRCTDIIAPAFVFYSLATVWQAFFRGAGDTVFPLVVSIITQFAYRIAAIGPFLAIWPTPSGIWYLYVSSWFLMFALDWAYHKTGFWKRYAAAIKKLG